MLNQYKKNSWKFLRRSVEAVNRHLLGATILLLLSILIPGCGPGGPPKVNVRGAVQYDGKPIANGQITFDPIEGTVGPVSAAVIKDGQYLADAKGGVPLGRHRVMIEGFRPPLDASGNLIPDAGRDQYVPAKYNTQTELTVEVTDEQSPLIRDFTLAP